MEVTIRRARKGDGALLLSMQRDCLPGDAPLASSYGYWWIATLDGSPVAFACLAPTRSDPRMGYLARAGVLAGARGHGIQKRLIRVREAAARRLGMLWMVTDTHRENHASSNSLASLGYRLYEPQQRWAFHSGLYWRKKL